MSSGIAESFTKRLSIFSSSPQISTAAISSNSNGQLVNTSPNSPASTVVNSNSATQLGQLPHHHRFVATKLATVTKCNQCSKLVWGYMSKPHRCVGLFSSFFFSSFFFLFSSFLVKPTTTKKKKGKDVKRDCRIIHKETEHL